MRHSYLFWNVFGKDLTKVLVELVKTTRPTVIALAENPVDLDSMTRRILDDAHISYDAVGTLNTKIAVLVAGNGPELIALSDLGRGVVFRVQDGTRSYLAALLHLPSKMAMDAPTLEEHASQFVEEVERVETSEGHRNTIVAGDFNMDPFEPGMVSARAFHALRTPDVLRMGMRRVGQRERHSFYNPFWSTVGREGESVPGTYYYRGNSVVEYFWHSFDQVIIRPQFAHALELPSVRILASTPSVDLRTRTGRPNRREFSDHFPITFTLCW
ncbi:MAG: hypothetical protein ICCCNLDF_03510 [Planctomycetes bacterium]|nr:hypothetical protein [Planctomycetota bacterium]